MVLRGRYIVIHSRVQERKHDLLFDKRQVLVLFVLRGSLHRVVNVHLVHDVSLFVKIHLFLKNFVKSEGFVWTFLPSLNNSIFQLFASTFQYLFNDRPAFFLFKCLLFFENRQKVLIFQNFQTPFNVVRKLTFYVVIFQEGLIVEIVFDFLGEIDKLLNWSDNILSEQTFGFVVSCDEFQIVD